MFKFNGIGTKPVLRISSTMKKKAFTMIEILVVVTIIGVLFGTAVISYRSLSQGSRDSRRRADLEQIRAALEMWRSSEPTALGQYPNLPEDNCDSLSGLVNFNEYLPVIPTDPKANAGVVYKCDSAASGYTLYSTLENTNNGVICGGSGDCGTGSPCEYAVGPYGKTCGP